MRKTIIAGLLCLWAAPALSADLCGKTDSMVNSMAASEARLVLLFKGLHPQIGASGVMLFGNSIAGDWVLAFERDGELCVTEQGNGFVRFDEVFAPKPE
ncbi:hypothetical protein [Oceanibacterium hippocampi]|uniref:Uncharacterized protein n=1 Tax=Oceanibacterium hippocampi TaxID=745714 RepID=A0A1Y5SWL3_9PROT|nr:hypothetical protein [Oceanibacterium hippocampi]SLN50373.1 hypothetical protein OCH7691_02220 [Oceanibacterium hippocampi]